MGPKLVREPGHNELVEVAWSGVADRDIVILPRSSSFLVGVGGTVRDGRADQKSEVSVSSRRECRLADRTTKPAPDFGHTCKEGRDWYGY